MTDSFKNAMVNRSLGDIKNNLQFLVEASIITSAQHDTIISQLPVSAENSARALPAVPTQALSHMNLNSQPTPAASPAPEKKSANVGYYADTHTSNAPPPAYPSVPATPLGPPVLAHANALYQYNAQDAGDLALMPNDRVVVTEYMNTEWWKGKNERTGMEGIFPASYVRKEEKSLMPMVPPSAPAPSNYGNMPLDVASSAQPHEPSKAEQQGKKFGKKLGNAAIFGAGATIGGKIVNGIF
ncbi:SH3 domain-containing protein [Paraphoma chrysanthemicola]|uniref:SH3 domain-containing protein n=1 Tax=Paraphoma chrysanthemicola TaxID=798071 RepID=A0A8K0W455_9PLEO|nr:SH3 domain-containing protein [Paraphoma chrysanthemicola]